MPLLPEENFKLGHYRRAWPSAADTRTMSTKSGIPGACSRSLLFRRGRRRSRLALGRS